MKQKWRRKWKKNSVRKAIRTLTKDLNEKAKKIEDEKRRYRSEKRAQKMSTKCANRNSWNWFKHRQRWNNIETNQNSIKSKARWNIFDCRQVDYCSIPSQCSDSLSLDSIEVQINNLLRVAVSDWGTNSTYRSCDGILLKSCSVNKRNGKYHLNNWNIKSKCVLFSVSSLSLGRACLYIW